MRKFILTAMLLLIPRFAAFAAVLPIISISRATINYSNNQVTFNGSGFEPSKKSPTVLFAGSALTVVSYSDTQIVAALPANTVAGNFTVLIVNSFGEFFPYELTYGSAGPQGPMGPQGPQGQAGAGGGGSAGRSGIARAARTTGASRRWLGDDARLSLGRGERGDSYRTIREQQCSSSYGVRHHGSGGDTLGL
jgi:IPT/TIG domain